MIATFRFGVGLGLALTSVFIRQIGLAIFFGFVVAYPFWRGLGRKWFLQAVVPAVLAFVALKAYERGLIAVERMPRIYDKFNQALSEPLRELTQLKLGVVKVPIIRLRELLIYLGLFTAPFSLLLWPSSLSRLSRRGRIVELGWVGGLTVLLTAACAVRKTLDAHRARRRLGFWVGSSVGAVGRVARSSAHRGRAGCDSPVGSGRDPCAPGLGASGMANPDPSKEP